MRALLRYVWGADVIEQERERVLATLLFVDIVAPRLVSAPTYPEATVCCWRSRSRQSAISTS